MKAYVLIETAAGKTKNVKKALLKVKGGRASVEAMDAVTGPLLTSPSPWSRAPPSTRSAATSSPSPSGSSTA
jgi:hypothetical protein